MVGTWSAHSRILDGFLEKNHVLAMLCPCPIYVGVFWDVPHSLALLFPSWVRAQEEISLSPGTLIAASVLKWLQRNILRPLELICMFLSILNATFTKLGVSPLHYIVPSCDSTSQYSCVDRRRLQSRETARMTKMTDSGDRRRSSERIPTPPKGIASSPISARASLRLLFIRATSTSTRSSLV